MVVLLIVGFSGLALTAASLVAGDVLKSVTRGRDRGGLVTSPVVGPFFTGFGFGGAVVLAASDAGALSALAAGAVFGAVAAAVALFTHRSMSDGSTASGAPSGGGVSAG